MIGLNGSICIFEFYYYKLLFDQINDQIEMIYQQTMNDKFILSKYQIRLIYLSEKHNSIGILVEENNLMLRRSCAVYFIVLACAQIIPLNLYLNTNIFFHKMFYLIYMMTFSGLGFFIAYFLSTQIKSAHKPYKIIYKIFSKQRFMFRFKWKVSKLSYIFTFLI